MGGGISVPKTVPESFSALFRESVSCPVQLDPSADEGNRHVLRSTVFSVHAYVCGASLAGFLAIKGIDL